jgi:putative peptidoglycan lipid II flippase
MLLNIIFVTFMVQADFLAPHVGLALATTVSAYFNALRLASRLRDEKILSGDDGFNRTLLKILLASIAMALFIYFMLPQFDSWSDWRWYDRLLELALIILPAILCYGAVLWIMGIRPKHLVA